MSRTFEAALSIGLPVFPCLPDKRPATAHGYKDATAGPGAIARFNWRERLIGVPTGRAGVAAFLKLETEDAATLKSLFPARDGTPSVKAIGKKLRTVTDSPVWVEEEIWTLRAKTLPHGKLTDARARIRGAYGAADRTGRRADGKAGEVAKAVYARMRR
jgi:Bifunctional DNA primase/polymerase, N-terminal